MKALLIEDDEETAEAVSLAFQTGWPEVQLVSTHLGREGVELADTECPDIIILDIGLPDMSGLEALGQIRQFSSVPVIVLTVTQYVAEVAKELEERAEACVVKPCGHLELLTRIKAVLGEK